ncbi:MAG: cupin domain-containing protein [Planctomycetota bacterium]
MDESPPDQPTHRQSDNLFADLPAPLVDELVQVLAQANGIRIERIVSSGHSSPTGFWYDQEDHEWVAVLQGAAELQFADRTDLVRLQAGDHLMIPSHQRHRVASTSKKPPTIWLAVFFHDG